MADEVGLKIDDLPAASSVLTEDLLVLQQNGTAKKLPGSVLVSELAKALDGHGGIQSIVQTGEDGFVETYTVTMADGTTAEFTVTNGRSVDDIQYAGTVDNVTTVQITYNDGKRQDLTMNLPRKYLDTPFDVIELPQNQRLPRYEKKADGTLAAIGTLSTFSPIRPCPRYLGIRLEQDAVVYLYICDYVDGEYVPDATYELGTYVNSAKQTLFNYLNSPGKSRILEVEEGKYFYYSIREKGEGVTIIGSDTWPDGAADNIAVVPDSVSSDFRHVKSSASYYSVVLPEDCSYAVLAEPGVKTSGFRVACVTEKNAEANNPAYAVGQGASFGYIPAGMGAALLTIPADCHMESLRIYTSKPVEASSVGGRRQKAHDLAERLVRDFNFKSRKGILWNDSTLPLLENKRFYGVPYSSRWVNSHYVGFEVSAETALNALSDPLSIAYDGGVESITVDAEGNRTANRYPAVSGNKTGEISDNGGPGYGLVCSAFTSLIFGSPYPQSNRGYTFDENFAMIPMTALVSGTVAVNKSLSHCVMVDELYPDGYAVFEATDPCVAKTVHTNDQKVSGSLNGKTIRSFLDNYLYTVANLDDSGYGKSLLSIPDSLPMGVVRPWRGHKAVYGPWDKVGSVGSYKGSGIGVTIHPTQEQTAGGQVPVIVEFIPLGSTERQTVLSTSVLATTQYLSIADVVTGSGTYYVSCGDGNTESLRYYDHEPVTLTVEADGRAVFSHPDVLYAYVRVRGYGGTWGRGRDNNDVDPMVIAAGKYYPDLADMGRITEVYAAIVADPDSDCWGKYSCLCSKGGNV